VELRNLEGYTTPNEVGMNIKNLFS